MKKIVGVGLTLALLGMVDTAYGELTVIGTATFNYEYRYLDGYGDVGRYNLIYDDDNNGKGLVWIDYSRSIGSFDWAEGWIDTLNLQELLPQLPNQPKLIYNLNPGVSINWQGEWRLPETVDGLKVFGYDGTTTAGYNIVSSEFGHLYYEELGNSGLYDKLGNILGESQFSNMLENLGPFEHLSSNVNLSGTEYEYEAYPYNNSYVWGFNFRDGGQTTFMKSPDGYNYALMAVRPALVSMPGIDDDQDSYSIAQGDCNDADASINPGATEICDNNDNDCNSGTSDGADETWINQQTTCGRGVCVTSGQLICSNGSQADNCTPLQPQEEVEISCADGLDNDCDGETDSTDSDCAPVCHDNDGDGYGNPGDVICSNGAETDCNDNDQAVNPGAQELCDSIDNNCADGVDEGFALGLACSEGQGQCASTGTNICSGDMLSVVCSVIPGQPVQEICDNLDNDCDGLIDDGVGTIYYLDSDGDGFGSFATTIQACEQPAQYVNNDDDCDDADELEHPGQTWYKDADNDNYSDGTVNTLSCTRPVGYNVAEELEAISGDCDDSDAALQVCNTPISEEPVAVEGGDSNEVGVTFPNISDGGETTIETLECNINSPAGFTLNQAKTCYDIQTTAVFDGPVEVCISYQDSEIPTPPGESSLIMLSCDSLGGNCASMEFSSLDTINNVFCSFTSHFSIFAIGTEPDSDFDGWKDSIDNCPDLFNPVQEDMDGDNYGDPCDDDRDGDLMPNSWEELHGLNPDVADGGEDADGDGFNNQVEFFFNIDPQVADDALPQIVGCAGTIWDLQAGFNMVSVSAEDATHTAFTILSAIGDETIVTSIQRFNPEISTFETASYDEDGIVTGVDFWLEPGKGYILYMKEDMLNFNP